MKTIHAQPVSWQERALSHPLAHDASTFFVDFGLAAVGGLTAEMGPHALVANALCAGLGSGFGALAGIKRARARFNVPLSNYTKEMIPGFALIKISQKIDAVQIPSIAGGILLISRGFVGTVVQLQEKNLRKENSRSQKNAKIVGWVTGTFIGIATSAALAGSSGVLLSSLTGALAARVTKAAVSALAKAWF